METGWILPLSYHPKTIIMDPHDPQVVLYWMDYNNVGAEKWTLLTQMWRPNMVVSIIANYVFETTTINGTINGRNQWHTSKLGLRYGYLRQSEIGETV